MVLQCNLDIGDKKGFFGFELEYNLKEKLKKTDN